MLPLAFIPLQTPALARARMIKNPALDSVVELYRDARSGSGQIGVEDLPMEFGWCTSSPHPDFLVLRKLALLPSFDVYSLRILLRHHGIAVNEAVHLKLSDAKNLELTGYMKRFTRPLIAHVYGGEAVGVDRFEQLVRLFRDPDGRQAIMRLKMLAASLDIPVLQVPQFLEDYGDVFLSLSYYREAFDRLVPLIDSVRTSVKNIGAHHQLKRDKEILRTCCDVHGVLASSFDIVRKSLTHFDTLTDEMWFDVSAERFQGVRQRVIASHATIGGLLCALGLKLTAWQKTFPTPRAGGPMRRADFIVNDMRRGIGKIRELEASAPKLATTGNGALSG